MFKLLPLHLLWCRNDLVGIHVECLRLLVEQCGDTFHTNDLLCYRAVQSDLQELGTALLCAVLDDQAIRAASDDIHITLEVYVVFVAHVVEVQTLDGRV